MLDLILAAEEAAAHGEPAINPFVIGGITLAILLALLAVTMLFGAGREHDGNAEPDHRGRDERVHRMAARQEERLAGEAPTQLRPRDDRSGERERADRDADADLDEVDRPLHPRVHRGSAG